MHLRIKWLAILYLLLISNLYAQKVIGINAGFSLSSVNLQKNYQSTHPGFGTNIGIDYLLRINSSFDFESGIFYRQKGQKYNQDLYALTLDGNFAEVEEKHEYQLNYLQLPLNLNYKFNSDVFITGGIYLAYGLDSYYLKKSKFSYNGTKEDETFITKEKLPSYKAEVFSNIVRAFKKFDFGLSVGGGYRFGRFCAKAEFNLGLTNALIIHDPFLMQSATWKYKNHSLSLSLIYYTSDKYYKIRNL